MSTAITLAFEAYLATQTAAQQPVVLDEFVFANVPGLDPEAPVDPAEGIPQTQIVWRQAVDKSGVINSDTVVYSVLLGTEVGDFTFNWVGLINKSSGMLAMVTHIPPQEKYANVDGNQGNALTRSFVMEYSGAQAATLINVPAETWQIDFTARLGAMDEHDRVTNVDLYGPGAFFGDGFLVRESAGAYSIQPGAGYVGGLRVLLGAAAPVNAATRPTKVWVDASWTGTAASVWNTQQTITVAPTLANYVQDGISHYVFAVAQINADGSVTDLRPKGTVDGGQQASLWLRKDKNLSDVNDAAEGRKSLGCGTSATKDIVTSPTDTTAGRVLTVGYGGWGIKNGTAPYLASIFDIACSGMYAALGKGSTTPTEGMPDDSGNTRYGVLAANIYSDQYWVTLISNREYYVGNVNVTNKTVTWYRFYNSGYKPTAADTGAVARAGDTMTGALGLSMVAPNIALQCTNDDTRQYIMAKKKDASGSWYVGKANANSESLMLWNYQANSGIEVSADGRIHLNSKTKQVILNPDGAFDGEIIGKSANNFRIVYGNYGAFWRQDGINLYLMLTNSGDQYGSYNALRPFAVNLATGDVTINKLGLVNYANFDARYYTQSAANAKFITQIRLGAYIDVSNGSGNLGEERSGYVVTMGGDFGSDNGYYRLRKQQYLINGTWYDSVSA